MENSGRILLGLSLGILTVFVIVAKHLRTTNSLNYISKSVIKTE